MKLITFFTAIFIFSGCIERPTPSSVSYSTTESRQEEQESKRQLRLERLEQERLKEIARKNTAWERITIDAQESYVDIASIIKKKCTDCHDENKKLPVYGRVFGRYNPVFRHQEDGLAAIDFSNSFPLKTSDGYKPESEKYETTASEQISFLKAIKQSVIDRSMPLKSYTFIYRGRKVFDNDEKAIIGWVDPLIEKLRDFKNEFESDLDDGSVAFKVKRIFEAKCYRCHANNNDRGNFGGIDNLEQLIKTKYIDHENPEDSELFQQVLSGEMPTNKNESLTQEELGYVKDWIIESTRNSEQ
jgi:hypothetical protein